MGAGGHSKVLVDIVRRHAEFHLVGMIDADEARWGQLHCGVPILGGEGALPDLLREGVVDAAFVGLGGVPSNARRRALYERLKGWGFPIVSLVHPSAVIADSVRMDEGVMVMGGAVINPEALLERSAIVNSMALVEHDCRIGAFAHICPGARLGGSVEVGEEAFVGLGSVVIQGVRIGAHAVVGAGAVVLADVPQGVTVVGCPARAISPFAHGPG